MFKLELPLNTASILIFWTADYMELWQHQVFPGIGVPTKDIEEAVKEGFRNNSCYTFVTVDYWNHMGKEISSQRFFRKEVLGLS